MFLGLEWYWWLIIIAAGAASVPFKIRFMKWRDKRGKEKRNNRKDKWGEEE